LDISEKDILNRPYHEFEALIYERLFRDRLIKAAITIQRFYRMHLHRKKFQEHLDRRVQAKTVILRAWKKTRWTRLLKAMAFQRKHTAALNLQRHMKAYIVRKHT